MTVAASTSPLQPSQYLKAAAASDRFCRYKKTYYLTTLLVLLLIALAVYLGWRLLFNGKSGSAATRIATDVASESSKLMSGLADAAPLEEVDVGELVAALSV